jgi:hypothetical protein
MVTWFFEREKKLQFASNQGSERATIAPPFLLSLYSNKCSHILASGGRGLGGPKPFGARKPDTVFPIIFFHGRPPSHVQAKQDLNRAAGADSKPHQMWCF